MTQCRLRQLTVVRSVFVSSFRFLLCVLVNRHSCRWFLSSLFLCLVPLICLHLVSLFLTFLDFQLPVVVVVLSAFVVDFSIQRLCRRRYRRSSHCCASGHTQAVVPDRAAKPQLHSKRRAGQVLILSCINSDQKSFD